MASNSEKRATIRIVKWNSELLLLEQRLKSKFKTSITRALEPIQEQLNKLANTGEEVAQINFS